MGTYLTVFINVVSRKCGNAQLPYFLSRRQKEVLQVLESKYLFEEEFLTRKHFYEASWLQ